MHLHVHDSGEDPTATRGTVVFLHGFPFDSSVWEPQLGSLPDGWRALVPDLRGFGRSDLHADPDEVPTGVEAGSGVARPTEPVLTTGLLADDVARLIEREEAGPAVVCGLSMGGYVAFELLRRRPELIRALVLADTRPGPDTDEGRENRMRTAQSARDDGARPIATAMMPSLLTPATLGERPEVAEHVRGMILGTPPATIIAALAGMAMRRDSTPDLARIEVPALVVVGAEDAITPPDTARAMADAIPGARLVVVEGAGHLANLEQPEAFNRALGEFLGGLG